MTDGKPLISFPMAMAFFGLGVMGVTTSLVFGWPLLDVACYAVITVCAAAISYYLWTHHASPAQTVYHWRDDFDYHQSKLVHNQCLSNYKYGRRYVYIIRDVQVSGLYKIGRSRAFAQRLFDFGVKLPFEVHLVHLIECQDECATEAQLHRAFRRQRRNGEWFDLSDQDLEWIKASNGHKESENPR